MSEHLRHLCQHARVPDLVPAQRRPAARWSTAHMHYDLTPEELAEHHARFITEFGVQRHRRLLRHHARAHRRGRRALRATSSAGRRATRARARRDVDLLVVPFDQDTSFLIIGERTNANGSKKFRDAHARRPTGTPASQMAKDQVKEGAHVLDVCVDYVGRDGTARHGRDRPPLRHAGERAAGARLHRAPGDRGRPAVARRAGHPQLGQPRGRRGAGLPPRPSVRAGPRVRRRRDLPAHRRGGPGPRRRVEAAGRPPHPRPRRRAATASSRRPHLRRADLPAVHRRRRPPPRRHGHHRGHPPHQGRAARRAHRRSACRTCRSASSPRPATCSTRCSCTSACRPGSTRPSCTRPRSCRSTASPTSSARSAST